MRLRRALQWIGALLLAMVLLPALYIALFGWNWLRAPIERLVLHKTGRVLVIGGELRLRPQWPAPRFVADQVSFANPAWTQERQMLGADQVELSIDVGQLLQQNLVFPEVLLRRPVVYLERGSAGRKNWLLDQDQQDDDARILIGRLTLDHGVIGFDDAQQKTRIRAEISSIAGQADGAADAGVTFSAHGQFKGLPLKAQGSGGPVLALRDESTAYPLKLELGIGRTSVRAHGSVTSLLKLVALDMQVALRGDNLEQLYPLLGIAFPATRPYATEGHLLHSGTTWRYERFSGRVGASDIAGSMQLDTRGQRPALQGEMVSSVLDLEDLAPMIGARPAPVASDPKSAPTRAHWLPDLSLKADRWSSVDAEVSLRAKTIRRAKALPLEGLDSHLSLRDAVLTLDPLTFGLAGGELNGVIALDGRADPIQARARITARKVQVARLFPTVALGQTSIGQINGEFDLAGRGNSVARMLATSSGSLGLVVAGGEISRLMMEKAGLHLWEILQLSVTGDRLIKLRCAVADFEVKAGVMHADALVFDTAVTTIIGTGDIDLAQEKLDLTLVQKTKNTSPLALRSPIYIRGSFAQPEVGVDKGQVALRALGAAALGAINPLLVLIPLVDPGPGKDSDCRQLVREARPAALAAAKAGPGAK